LRPLENLPGDARFALRHFRRTWGSTAAMVLVLAVGIGANTALYAGLQAVLTLPAPGIPRDERLVRIRGEQERPGRRPISRRLSYSEVLTYTGHRELFAGVAAWTERSVALDLGDPARGLVAARGTFVTADYFRLLGVRPAAGAGLPISSRGDAESAPVAVISHSLWEQLGRSPDVVGRTLRVDGFPILIVGVAPRRFAGVDTRAPLPGLWLPLEVERVLDRVGASSLDRPDSASLSAFARLRPGVSAREAGAVVRTIAARQPAVVLDGKPAKPSAKIVPLLGYNRSPGAEREMVVGAASLGALTLLILLITCTNVSGLLVGLALRRRHEIAVRLSLGASRGRIVRQLLTESVLLAVAAGMLGAAVLATLVRLFGRQLPELQVQVDWRVMAFTFGFAIGTGLLFGVSPALHATRLAVAEVLKDSAATVSGSRSRLQRALVVAQVALTQPLLVGVSAMVLLSGGELGDRRNRDVDTRIASLGFAYIGGDLIFRAGSSSARSAALEEYRTTVERVVERLRSLPAVVGAVPDVSEMVLHVGLTVPPEHRVPGRTYSEAMRLVGEGTAPGYFALMGIPIIRGRDFTEGEARGQGNPVIIGAELARALWGNADPIGRSFRGGGSSRASRDLVVVGVVDDAAIERTDIVEPRIFVPSRGLGKVLVRTAGPAEPMLPLLRAVASQEAPHLPISDVTTLAAIKTLERSEILRASMISSAGGMLALLLSAVGLYALIAFAVGQRTREIGIRIAVGARPRQVVGLFLASGLRLSMLGLAIGLPLSLLAHRRLSEWAGADSPQASTPAVAAMIAVAVVAVASVAAWLPARRAARIDPVTALRSE
jgi:putative ABC transport system permease protein